MRYAADPDFDETAATDTQDKKNTYNRVAHEFDFHGFKDDWRYSLRMGGCLYEAARWVYDESSFHRTSRLTYTDDTLFMNDPFNPMDGSDIFGAHAYGNINAAGLGVNAMQTLIDGLEPTLAAEEAAKADYENLDAWSGTTCAGTAPSDSACATAVTDMITSYVNLNFCFYQAANDATACQAQINDFNTKRTAVHNDAAGNLQWSYGQGADGCLVTAASQKTLLLKMVLSC